MNSTRLLGTLLAVAGLGLTLIAGLWIASQVAAGTLEAGGAVLGAGLVFIPVALLIGAGAYLYIRGGAEAKEVSEMQQQRRLLDIVKSRGQVSVSDLALEMNASVDQIKNMVHSLVGLQVFSGYVNWDQGVLYSADASNLRELDKCKNCGGEINLVGKGIAVCRFCGTEYFLS